MTPAKRRIVRIDEEKCDGCGACIPACAEGALQLVDGKARLTAETHCDGLGACIGECPRGAISIEERPAAEFGGESSATDAKGTQGEPAGRSRDTEDDAKGEDVVGGGLPHFPIQLGLVRADAPFLRGSELALAADCTAFACPDFGKRFVTGRSLLVACPKLDSLQKHLEKLMDIVEKAAPAGITVIQMEVPCCAGLTRLAEEAVRRSGKQVPVSTVTIGVNGEVLTESPA
ncbi:MAG: ATP-binding protein [Chloroflexota bacterium]